MLFLFMGAATISLASLSLHAALPISIRGHPGDRGSSWVGIRSRDRRDRIPTDRKSTRLNSSHRTISYAVFCLKKKTHTHNTNICKSPHRNHPYVRHYILSDQ